LGLQQNAALTFAAVDVIEADDIIFAEVIAGLDLDKL
jgi:hypothetical protein